MSTAAPAQVDPLHEIASIIRANLWLYVTDAPPDQVLMSGICNDAAQLQISRYLSLRHGCSRENATSFILAADGLALDLDRLGGAERLGSSLIWQASTEANDFAAALLDALVSE